MKNESNRRANCIDGRIIKTQEEGRKTDSQTPARGLEARVSLPPSLINLQKVSFFFFFRVLIFADEGVCSDTCKIMKMIEGTKLSA